MHNVFKIGSVALALLLISVQIFHIFNFPLWTDDAFFGIVAKNLAQGNGYAASVFEKNFPFLFGITSGPVIILPTAFLIKIFGNQYWVLGASIMLITWFLLIMIFLLAQKITEEKKWIFAFLSLLLALVFSINRENYGIYGTDHFSLWYLLLGEIPAALTAILGALLLFSANLDLKKILIAVAVLGLSILCKTSAAIACAVILFSFALKILLQKELKFSGKFLLIALAGLVFLVPYFLFELVKIFALGLPAYLEMQQQNGQFYKNIAFVDFSYSFPAGKIAHLFEISGFSILVLMVLLPYFMWLAIKSKSANSLCRQIGIVLIFCFFLHLFWWIFFSIFRNDRYLVMALFYLAFGISFLLCCVDFKNKSQLQKSGFLILLLLFSCAESFEIMASEAFSKNAKQQAQISAAKEIAQLRKKGVIMVSCGINYELEYLLPQNNNFRNCKDLSKKLSQPTMLVNDFVLPGKILRYEFGQSFTEIKEPPSAVAARCREEYSSNEYFSLSWCK